MRKNMIERGRPQMAIWRMRIACWITNATDTYSEYVLLTSFPLHQWLREPALIGSSYRVIQEESSLLWEMIV